MQALEKKLYYLTFNDSVNGIYRSQVVDVATLLASLNVEVKIVAFFSMRTFFNERKKLKNLYSNCTALPMFPGIDRWWLSKYLLKLKANDQKLPIIARGIFAANLAIEMKGNNRRVCYDGRGNISAEFKEFNLSGNKISDDDVKKLERSAVENSDCQISVSEKLVSVWKNKYGLKPEKYTVIPCTVSSNKYQKTTDRSEFGWDENNIVLVYSGSSQGWQSFQLLKKTLQSWLDKDERIRVLFLAPKDDNIEQLKSMFGNRIAQKFVEPKMVGEYLLLADYGLLIRNRSETNFVASPVKFAEYLKAGLKVLISSDLGDYSSLVQQNSIGHVIQEQNEITLKSISNQEKESIRKFCNAELSKDSKVIREKYKSVLKMLEL